ncbi:MAG: hypothetical protein L0214_15555, partial [candidate division NC10 bacterium]|nr:hypothetical protein [candidate division NC10 bacterium]
IRPVFGLRLAHLGRRRAGLGGRARRIGLARGRGRRWGRHRRGRLRGRRWQVDHIHLPRRLGPAAHRLRLLDQGLPGRQGYGQRD